jgi:hypothetical protein
MHILPVKNEAERTEDLPRIGFLPLKAVPLTEFRLYAHL